MQIHLVKFQTFSQQAHPAQDAELPSFEEAFDTESLRKFFKQHDSHMNTPFTTYSETPMYEDLQASLTDTKSIFGSPINKYVNVPSFNLGSEMEDGFNTKIFEMLDKKPYGLEEMKNGNGSQYEFLEERERFESKVKEVMNDQDRTHTNLNEKSSSLFLFNSLKEELDQSLQGLGQDETRIDLDNKIKSKKKAVFIIERNVTSKVISKKEKEEKKSATLVKRKKSDQSDKKEEENKSLKKSKKDKKDKQEKIEKEEKVEKSEKSEKLEKSNKNEKKPKKKAQNKNLVDLILEKKVKNSSKEEK